MIWTKSSDISKLFAPFWIIENSSLHTESVSKALFDQCAFIKISSVIASKFPLQD